MCTDGSCMHGSQNFTAIPRAPPDLLAGLLCAAHDEGHILNLAEGGHGAVPGQGVKGIRWV